MLLISRHRWSWWWEKLEQAIREALALQRRILDAKRTWRQRLAPSSHVSTEIGDCVRVQFPVSDTCFGTKTNHPPKANSAFHPAGVSKWVPASAGKAGMVHSVNGWTRGVQLKLWDPLRTRAISERLTGVFTTRRYTNLRLPLSYLSSLRRVRLLKRVSDCPWIPAQHLCIMFAKRISLTDWRTRQLTAVA